MNTRLEDTGFYYTMTLIQGKYKLFIAAVGRVRQQTQHGADSFRLHVSMLKSPAGVTIDD